MLPPWFPAGLDDWSKVARLESVDEVASDPYWEKGATEEWVREKYAETARKLTDVARQYGKDGIDNIFAWSYRGTETLSWLKSDNPDAVAKAYRDSLK